MEKSAMMYKTIAGNPGKPENSGPSPASAVNVMSHP